MTCTDYKALGARIKKYRMKREWSVARMSIFTRVSVGALWNLEQGRQKPSDLTLYRLQEAVPELFERFETVAS